MSNGQQDALIFVFVMGSLMATGTTAASVIIMVLSQYPT